MIKNQTVYYVTGIVQLIHLVVKEVAVEDEQKQKQLSKNLFLELDEEEKYSLAKILNKLINSIEKATENNEMKLRDVL